MHLISEAINKTTFLFLFLGIIVTISSCKKDKLEESTTLPQGKLKDGLLVLHEGLFNQNNSTLNWVDLSTGEMSDDVFLEKNNRLLGDVANDMIAYGGKIYIVVTTSSTLEILDKQTLKSLKQISFDYQNKAQQPRIIIGKDKSVYVTSYDGYVTEVDTTNLKVKNRIKVGRNPEGITAYGDKIFVANSGGLDAPNYDHTVFAIDSYTKKVVDTFEVGINPGVMTADAYGNIYVVKRGDYAGKASTLVKIDSHTGEVEQLSIPATTLALRGDELYLSYYDFNSGQSKISLFNCSTQSLENENFISGSYFNTLYGVFPLKSNQIIGLDAMDYVNSGYLRFFNNNGELTKSYKVGLNPNTILHYE